MCCLVCRGSDKPQKESYCSERDRVLQVGREVQGTANAMGRTGPAITYRTCMCQVSQRFPTTTVAALAYDLYRTRTDRGRDVCCVRGWFGRLQRVWSTCCVSCSTAWTAFLHFESCALSLIFISMRSPRQSPPFLSHLQYPGAGSLHACEPLHYQRLRVCW